MSQFVQFTIKIEGLAPNPMRFYVKYVQPNDGIAIVTKIFENVNLYLKKGYNVSIENVYVFISVL